LDELLDTFLNAGDIYEKYGIKGCLIAILGIAAVIGGIIGLAMWLGSLGS
jgi:hypothetical protein